jgi:HD-GYP domain-containing protein (c-di-GMP phosphodiesterase class II)
MPKKISVQELAPGMVVVDAGISRRENPRLYSVPGAINSSDEILRIYSEGFRDVFIKEEDDPETVPPTAHPADGGSEGTINVGFKDSLILAHQLHSEHIEYSKKVLQDLKSGGNIDINEATALITNTIDSLDANHDAMLAVSKLLNIDTYTYTHSVNVAIFSIAFGDFLEISRKDLTNLGIAAMFHDIGKVAIPHYILNKPGDLTEYEFSVIKTHTTTGLPFLKNIFGINTPILGGILSHHERFDGKGYPSGLKGELIPQFARIISIVDVYDALTSTRPYGGPVSAQKALGIIYGMRGKNFFTELVERFIRCLGVYPTGSIVRLNNGMVGFVIQQDSESPTKPNVISLFDEQGRKCEPELIKLNSQLAADGQPYTITGCEPAQDLEIDMDVLLYAF